MIIRLCRPICHHLNDYRPSSPRLHPVLIPLLTIFTPAEHQIPSKILLLIALEAPEVVWRPFSIAEDSKNSAVWISLKITILWLTFNFSSSPGLEKDDDEARLVYDLFNKGYNKNVRPAQDKDLPIEVKFGIAYTQIVDLVNNLFTKPF